MDTCDDCVFFSGKADGNGICTNEVLGRQFRYIPFIPCRGKERACWAFERDLVASEKNEAEHAGLVSS